MEKASLAGAWRQGENASSLPQNAAGDGVNVFIAQTSFSARPTTWLTLEHLSMPPV